MTQIINMPTLVTSLLNRHWQIKQHNNIVQIAKQHCSRSTMRNEIIGDVYKCLFACSFILDHKIQFLYHFVFLCIPGAPLLTQINFNPSMEK